MRISRSVITYTHIHTYPHTYAHWYVANPQSLPHVCERACVCACVHPTVTAHSLYHSWRAQLSHLLSYPASNTSIVNHRWRVPGTIYCCLLISLIIVLCILIFNNTHTRIACLYIYIYIFNSNILEYMD